MTLREVDVLLVDDRPEDLLTLQTLLESPAYNLVKASSGEQALRQLLERDFAVILLDVRMPGMDGFEVASIVRQRERSRHTPILFLTAGDADVGSIYRGYAVGGVDYLVKPIDRDVLRAKVAIFAELHRKDRQIAEQNQALREIERLRSQRHYRNLAEAIPQIVWTATSTGEVDYCNGRWETITGLGAQQALGWSWLGAVHPDDRADCEARWRQAIGGGEPYEVECRLRGRDGTFRWFLGRALPEKGEDQQIVSWLGTYTDCNELKRAQSDAETALEVREEFVSIASHELRTPIAALKLQLQSLRGRVGEAASANGDGKLSRKLEVAILQATRLGMLVENLLDVSRLSSARFTLELEWVDLAELAREVVERLGEQGDGTGSRFRVRARGPVVGHWDRLRLEQVLVNLLSNALKFSRGNPIEIGVSAEEGVARLSVRDRGVGIAPADLSRIFERGVANREHGGLGLGLYITRCIVERHGGTISATSEVGVGSTFSVELPLKRRLEDAPAA